MRVIARVKCVGTVKRCEINYSRHMGGRLFCWTDVTREYLCIIPRDTFMRWAKNLRMEEPLGSVFPKDFDDKDGKRVIAWIIGKEVKIEWYVQTLDDGHAVRYLGYVTGLANTEQESKRLNMGRKRRGRKN